MGHFDKSLCDCCVCPMECVLKQLIGKNINVAVVFGNQVIEVPVKVERVENFILFTDNGDFAIHSILTLSMDFDPQIQLKRIEKNIGECACIEDPMTSLLNSKINQNVNIVGLDAIILKVGEGIVLAKDQDCPPQFFIISTCFITAIDVPIRQINLFKKNIGFY
ncbi:hypothetical protein [Chengkuizengella sediminis]|uniref:hypothetical protein n=1 Tax=Chengkuizengella sediminis TaxID=1885917 RepID=UPI00138A40A7|nr:hypothetical protein [Chengkuizengella sediminis]NDI34681.1 hypothetical protein [Chengkuizengella sediminis]